MNSFDPARRDLLKLGTISAAVAATSLPSFAQSPTGSTTPLFFDIRTFGAVGDGKSLAGPAINQAIAAAATSGGGTVYLPLGRGSASPSG